MGRRSSDEWRALASRGSPTFAWNPLRRLEARIGDATLRAIRDGVLPSPPAYPSASLERIFHFEKRSHAFDAARHEWLNLREPQVIKGLAHFLSTGSFRQRIARVRCFLGAAFDCAGAQSLLTLVQDEEILFTDAVAEEARVDLIVRARTASGQIVGVVVEAKFGHHLTRGQLPAAKAYAEVKELGTYNAAFLIATPLADAVRRRITSRPVNGVWRPVSWWSLLTAVERRLGEEHDDVAFRALRHTIWHHSYG